MEHHLFEALVKRLKESRYKALVCKRPLYDGWMFVASSVADALEEADPDFDRKGFLETIGYIEPWSDRWNS